MTDEGGKIKGVRLDKYLSERDICSRREAKELISSGCVVVNGRVVSEMMRVVPGEDAVEVDDEGLKGKRSVLVYKPRGVISSKDADFKNVFDVFPELSDLNCVGRLDKESEGALILSNDGVITKKVTGLHKIEKKYLVQVQEKLMDSHLSRLGKGVMLADGFAKPVRIERAGGRTFAIWLTDGRKHQIRRMASAVKLSVVRLKRLCIGEICLGDLRSGEYRELTDEEVGYLKSFAN